MLDITKYGRKEIIVMDIDGQIFTGMGKYLTSEDNDDEGEQLLVIGNQIFGLNPDEIKKDDLKENKEKNE